MVVFCKDTVCFSPPMVAPGPCACCAWSRCGTAQLVVVVHCTFVGCAVPGVHLCKYRYLQSVHRLLLAASSTTARTSWSA